MAPTPAWVESGNGISSWGTQGRVPTLGGRLAGPLRNLVKTQYRVVVLARHAPVRYQSALVKQECVTWPTGSRSSAPPERSDAKC